jgi:hypothetical protein
MRSANRRSASGGIASSSATTNQEGSDFQAGTPIVYSNVLIEIGYWTA